MACDIIVPIVIRVMGTGEPVLAMEAAVPSPGAPGGERYIHANDYPIRGADGEVHGVGGVVLDATAQKHAQDDLRREAEFRERFVRIAQLASNLITNVLDYSPPGSPVRVDVGGADAAKVFLRVHSYRLAP